MTHVCSSFHIPCIIYELQAIEVIITYKLFWPTIITLQLQSLDSYYYKLEVFINDKTAIAEKFY